MKVGGYDLREELGRGGQGVVYRSHQRADGREVAVKILHKAGPGDRAHAEQATKLRHPGICSIREVGDEGGRVFVAMDLVQGKTLAAHLNLARSVSLSTGSGEATLLGDPVTRPRRAVDIVEQLARAAHAAHEMGLLHGDLKPSNVMLSEGGRAVLLDFSGTCGEPLSCGTPAYASPELFTSPGRADARSDVYGLGVLLYETATLEHPIRSSTARGVAAAVVNGDVRVPSRISAELPEGLPAVIEKALEREPSRRYSSALELAEDLGRLQRGDPVLARRSSVRRRIMTWTRRNRRLALGSGALALALVATLVLTALEGRAARHRLMDSQRYTDALLLPELLDEERGGDWQVLPTGIPELEDWLRSAEAVIARAETDRGGPDAALSDLLSAVVRVRGRVTDAATLHERSVGRHEARWLETLRDLTPFFGGVAPPPQSGLIPLGRDPTSGLHEFGHVQSGTLAERDPVTGRLVVGPLTGLVFTLVPGGLSPAVAGGASQVQLDPFLISRYELTLGQWGRLGGGDPRTRVPAPPPEEGPSHPARRLSWDMATRLLDHHGLVLPTEARWEHAARGGMDTPWTTGADSSRLSEHGNIAEEPGKRSGGDSGRRGRFKRTAPVGSFLPNAFGLHDVHGNVMELVRDAYGPVSLPMRAGDGERLGGNPVLRIGRGGAWSHVPSQVRFDARHEVPPEFRSYQGCRPVFPLRW